MRDNRTPTGEVKQHEGPENEIRVSGKTNILFAVERVENALKTHDHVTLSGINTGISKLLLLTEICKIKFEGLHQYNVIETLKVENQEGGNTEDSRFLTRFRVELHKNMLKTPVKGSFYQAPYSKEEVEKIRNVQTVEREEGEPRRGRGGFRGRGRGRGGRGRGFRGGPRDGESRGRGGFRGRGESRGGFRGRGEAGEGRGRGGFRGRGEGRGGRGRGEGRGGRGRGGFHEGRGGFQESRGGFQESRGGYQEGRGGYQGNNTRDAIPGLGGRGPKSGPK